MSKDLLFLFLAFMTIVLAIYYIVPKKYNFIVILVASVLFYAMYSKFMFFFLLSTVLSIYFGGLLIKKQNKKYEVAKETLEKDERKKLKNKIRGRNKLILFFVILFNLVILGILKYFNFFGSMVGGFFELFNVTLSIPVMVVVLPLGISYYTLQALSYIIDVCNGKYEADTNFCRVMLFVCYFPQLLEGPIGRYEELAPQFYNGVKKEFKNVLNGLLLVLWGFFKKVIIADRISIIVGEVFKNYEIYSGGIIVLAIVLFTIQLYAEFSGIIDVVRGISEMFGFKLAKNFNQPFFSKSVAEFWRRWHISLGTWFKDYVFYPISTSKLFFWINKKLQNRKSQFLEAFIQSAIALFVVWFTTGFWHGASCKYVVYGLYYYVLMMIGLLLEPLFKKIMKATKINEQNKFLSFLKILRTFILVNIGMLIFRASDLSVAFSMLGSIFQSGASNLIGLGVIDIFDTVLILIGVVILVIAEILQERGISLRNGIMKQKSFIKYSIIFVVFIVIIIFGAYGYGYLPPDPIYGGF